MEVGIVWSDDWSWMIEREISGFGAGVGVCRVCVWRCFSFCSRERECCMWLMEQWKGTFGCEGVCIVWGVGVSFGVGLLDVCAGVCFCVGKCFLWMLRTMVSMPWMRWSYALEIWWRRAGVRVGRGGFGETAGDGH